MTYPQTKPNAIQRAKIAWSVFKRGFPARPGPTGLKQSVPFAWPAWRENTPQWKSVSFEAYVEEGFNRNSIIYSAIMYKVRSKMSAPLRAYTGDPEKPELLPPDHELTKLVSRPNPHQSWAEFEALAEIYFNLGNCFIILVRPIRGGLPTAMYALRPDRVNIVPGDRTIKGYIYVPEGKSLDDGVPILPQDMMHVKLPNPLDPLEGMGDGMPPTAIGQSTDVDNDVTRFLKLFFQNGAMILGLLKFDVPMDDETVAAVKARWGDMYGGVDHWTDVGVLDQGGSYQRIGSTFEEMGFEAIDERNESRILGPLGVPPILIGTRTGLARSTYSNYGQARLAYWEDTALPELRLFEPEYQYHLQTEDGGFVAYDLSKVPALQKDTPTLVEAAHKMWQMGTPANMAYATVGLTVSDIPGGDIAWIPASVVPSGVDLDTDEDSMEGAAEAEDDERKARQLKQEEDEQETPEQLTEQYNEEIATLVALALADSITQDEFERRFIELVGVSYLALFLLGGKIADESDIARTERVELDEQIDIANQSIRDFANDIYEGRYSEEGGEESADNRISLWEAAALGVLALGQMIRRDDPKVMWVYDPSKEHCSDCVRLNGQVHRVSEWRKTRWRPQGSNLECGGWRCGCSFVEVAEDTRLSGSFALTPDITVKRVNGRQKAFA